MQSQKLPSSAVMVIVAATTSLMAGQIFLDFLISTRRENIPIHESIKTIASHISHEYTMNFWVKYTISVVPFNGGKWKEWTRAIKANDGLSPRPVQRYT
jgi:hypothetical protein